MPVVPASAAETGKDRCMNESRRKRNLMQEIEDRRKSRFKRGKRQVAKTWKQPEGSSIDDWIKKKRYIYTLEYYYSDIEKIKYCHLQHEYHAK